MEVGERVPLLNADPRRLVVALPLSTKGAHPRPGAVHPHLGADLHRQDGGVCHRGEPVLHLRRAALQVPDKTICRLGGDGT